MSAWSQFYENKMTALYRTNLAKKYKSFTDRIVSYKAKYLAEAGCGAGHISRILTESYGIDTHRLTLCDCDDSMLDKAIQNLQEAKPNQRANYVKGDITFREIGERIKINESILFHSHGVLEHFDDRGFAAIINNCLSDKRCIGYVGYVPGPLYQSKSFGDERLRRPDAYRSICTRFGISWPKISEFNDGFDFILEWGPQ